MGNSVWVPILIFTPVLIFMVFAFFKQRNVQDAVLRKEGNKLLSVFTVFTILFLITGIIQELVTAVDLTTATGSELEESIRQMEFFSRINTFFYLLFFVFLFSYNFLNRKKN